MGTPVDRSPALACLKGCWDYWCCCEACKLLYCGRKPGTDFHGLASGEDARCGFDESGFFCNLLDSKSAGYEVYTDGKGGKHDLEEQTPLCGSCYPRSKTANPNGKLAPSSREIS